MEIKTDNKPRDLLSKAELPADVVSDFDYVDDEHEHEPRFVNYRESWRDVNDMMAVRGDSPFQGWHGYESDTFFSGVLIKFTCEGDQVICGTYYS